MAYTDIAYCDTVLSSSQWVASTNEQKQYAIDIGQVWIDKYYLCVADDPVQIAIQNANAMLADLYVEGVLFSSASTVSVISGKKIKVGSIEIDTSYENGGSVSDNPFTEVDFLLGAACPVNPAQASAITVIRA